MYEKPDYLKNGPRKYEETLMIEAADGVELKAQEQPQAKV